MTGETALTLLVLGAAFLGLLAAGRLWTGGLRTGGGR